MPNCPASYEVPGQHIIFHKVSYLAVLKLSEPSLPSTLESLPLPKRALPLSTIEAHFSATFCPTPELVVGFGVVGFGVVGFGVVGLGVVGFGVVGLGVVGFGVVGFGVVGFGVVGFGSVPCPPPSSCPSPAKEFNESTSPNIINSVFITLSSFKLLRLYPSL